MLLLLSETDLWLHIRDTDGLGTPSTSEANRGTFTLGPAL